MAIKQLSVFLANKPGALSELCSIFADNNIDIATLSLADTKDFGILRLIIGEWERAKEILSSKGIMVSVTDMIGVEVVNQPGGMKDVFAILDKYSINVEYLYPYVSPVNGRAVILFRFDAPKEAIERLNADPNIRIVDQNDIFGKQC